MLLSFRVFNFSNWKHLQEATIGAFPPTLLVGQASHRFTFIG